MDITTANSLSHANLSSCSSTSSLAAPLFHSKKIQGRFPNSLCLPPGQSAKCTTQTKGLGIKATMQRSFVVMHASVSESPSSATDAVEERWLLEPVGDGDTKHIGFNVEMPSAFEIASSEVTVGRLSEKADVVIPVATVSGLHARIQKKGGKLLVTDLDSTNGTFIDDKRLRPGVVATVSSGSCITFGDTHLAIFRASKLAKVEPVSEPGQSEDKAETRAKAETSAKAESTEAAS